MAERTIDIIYRFIADTKSFEKDLKAAGNKELEQLGKPPSYKDLEKHLRGVENELNRLVNLNRITKEEAAKIKKEYIDAAKAVNNLTAALERRKSKAAYIAETEAKFQGANPNAPAMYPWQSTDVMKGQNKPLQDLAKLYNTGSRVAQQMSRHIKVTTLDISNFNREVQVEGRKSRATLEEIGRAVMVKGFSFYGLRMTGASIAQQGQLMAMIGGGISGGMFKMASDYIKNLEGATETSREWAAQMQRVEATQKRIGAVMASQSLPLLEKGADLLGKVASYIEKNPEQVGALMKSGLVLAGIGALTIAVGKGITLVADVAFISATINMLKGGREAIIAAGSFRNSANTMMKAAVINAGAANKLTIGKFAPLNKLAPPITQVPIGGGTTAAAGASLIPVLQSIAAGLAGFAAGAFAADKYFDALEGRDQKLEDYLITLKQSLSLGAKGLGDMLAGTGGRGSFDPLGMRKLLNIPDDLGDTWFKKVRDALFKVDKDSHGAAEGLEGISDILANSLKREEVLQAYIDYKADDMALVRKHYQDREKVIRDALDATRKANEKFADDMRKISQRMQSALSKAASDFAESNEKAERDYNERRQEIINEGNEQEQKEREQLQERLRKIDQEHLERRADLLASRDAVGLFKERKRYQRERADAISEANKETTERKREMQRRLEELRLQHEQEKAERLAEYQARVAEIREQARQDMEELRKQHQEELREIQINRNNRLQELDLQLREERQRRIDAFLQQVRDLDATLLGEEALRKQHQDAMLKELDGFLAKYRSGMGSLLNSIPSKQSGGYTFGGLYKLHNREFVVNPQTTKALENLMGGQLTQAGLVQMASRTQVTWNDSRRFDSRLQAADRRAINNDTLGILEKVLVR